MNVLPKPAILFHTDPSLDISDFNFAKLPQRPSRPPTRPSSPPGVGLEVESNDVEVLGGEFAEGGRPPPPPGPLPPQLPEETDLQVFDAVPLFVLQRLLASDQEQNDDDMMLQKKVRRWSILNTPTIQNKILAGHTFRSIF